VTSDSSRKLSRQSSAFIVTQMSCPSSETTVKDQDTSSSLQEKPAEEVPEEPAAAEKEKSAEEVPEEPAAAEKNSTVSEETPAVECAERDLDGSTEASAQDKVQEKAPFCLADLEAEIEALRTDLPSYIHRVGRLKVPSVVCTEEGQLKKVSDGVWDLEITVSGSEENEAYNFPFVMGIRFDRSWPEVPPDVRFQCICHHALTDDENGMVMPFYRTMPKDDRGLYTLKTVAHSIHKFLISPLETWNIPQASAPYRLLQSISMNEKMNKERLSVIHKYSSMVRHPELFATPAVWKDEWFAPAFAKARAENTPEAWRAACLEEVPGEVFSIPLFTDSFCELVLEEIFNFYASGLPAKRPNSMNNYGIILNEIGLEPLVSGLQKILQPIGETFFPGAGEVWDGNHCFIVRYREGEDLGLDMHTDDSDVTFNICLGLDFTASGLQFCGMMGSANHRKSSYKYMHKKVVFHLGRKRHGADDISSGERLNWILWNHSSTYRRSDEYRNPPYAKEDGPPDEVCVSYTHDRDYGIYKDYPAGKEHFKGRGWCPPKPFEYAGFQQDAEPVMGG